VRFQKWLETKRQLDLARGSTGLPRFTVCPSEFDSRARPYQNRAQPRHSLRLPLRKRFVLAPVKRVIPTESQNNVRSRLMSTKLAKLLVLAVFLVAFRFHQFRRNPRNSRSNAVDHSARRKGIHSYCG
jgi:hypothetical protein